MERPRPPSARVTPGSRLPPTPPTSPSAATPAPEVGARAPEPSLPPLVPACIRLDAPALMVRVCFRDLALSTSIVGARAGERFAIGAGRGARAPVSPAYTGGELDHALVEADAAGFALNLTPVMRATLWTAGSCLPLGPDLGAAQAPLALRPTDVLRVACGEMTFDVGAVHPEAPLPRPWLGPDWRREARYAAGVALVVLLGLAVVKAVPPDPRSLSLDDIAHSPRWARWQIKPPEPIPEPTPPGPSAVAPGAPGAKAAAGPAGAAGDKNAPRIRARLARKGPPENRATPPDAAAVRAEIERNSILGYFKRTEGTALGEVLDSKPALGHDAETALGNLEGTTVADAYGINGLHVVGTGRGGDGTGERMLGRGRLGTIGIGAGDPNATGKYGRGLGTFGTKKTVGPEIIPGIGHVTMGSLDKEIVRRIVRRNLNQVRFCYEQGLARRPGMDGRVVVQFMISATGRVLTSVMQSTTLPDVATTSCVVQAVRRWEFPAPKGGGLVQVSYPFQFQAAGG